MVALAATWTNAKPTLTDECGGRPADVVFVLDVSSSIWPKHFRDHVLTFVREVVASLHIGAEPEHTRIGAVTFSDDTQLEFHLNQFMDKDQLLNRVTKIKSRGGNTNTHDALAFVDQNLFLAKHGARNNVSRIVIVITDGASRMVKATLEAARALRDHGAAIFSIGVGNQVNAEQLRGMASEPSEHFVFEVTNFQALAKIKNELVIKTCKVEVTTTPLPATTTTTRPTTTTTTEPTTASTEPPATTELSTTTTKATTTATTTELVNTATTKAAPTTVTAASTTTEDDWNIDVNDSPHGDMDTVACINRPAEVYFVLDSSSSIWRVDFEESMLGFVRDVIDIFDVGRDRTRVGVITFSDAAMTVFGLASHVHKDELLKAINKNNVRYTPGLTYTAEALQKARANFRNEGRPGVQQIIILITDGQSRDPNATMSVARAAHRDGVTLFAVGVGDGVDLGELHAVASEPSNNFVLTVDDFTGLAASKERLASRTCSAIGNASALPLSDRERELLRPYGDGLPSGNKCGLQHADVLVAYDWHMLGGVAATQLFSSLHHLSATLDLLGADVTLGTLTSASCLTPLSTALSDTATFDKHTKSVLRFQQSSISGLLKMARLTGFTAKNGHRSSATKVLIVVLDAAATSHLVQVASEAGRLRSEDVEVFVVTSGVQGLRLVQEAASEPTSQHVIRLPGLDFSNYAYVSDLLANALCGDSQMRM